MADNERWVFGVAGNVVQSHTDKDGNVFYGTKSFTPGTKVYLDGKYWDESCEEITVVGLNRFGRFVLDSVSVDMLENVRTTRIYHSRVLNILDHDEWMEGHAWWGDTVADRKGTQNFVKKWNEMKNKTK